VENKKTYELNEEEINKLRMEVEKYTTEADLVRAAALLISPSR
jgi:small subunit ribosomal protein S13